MTDDLEEALELVDIEYDAEDLLRRSDDPSRKYKDVPEVRGCKSLGVLIPLLESERQQLNTMSDLISRYISHQGHSHPLCLAVFGSPGSGKSFAVKQIMEVIQRSSKVRLYRKTINLTQLSSPAELTGTLVAALIAAAQEEGTVPVIFFDEFDTTRDGAAYGWLSSFLAPMQDGEFLNNGQNVSLKKAVYVFAGGTASTMSEFTNRQGEPEFRRAKGPDFISRLRCSLDVQGPNESRRELRRALILRHEIAERVRRHGSGKFRLERPLLEAFLQAGRYRHGARSIAALIEHAELNSERLGWEILPPKEHVALQVDRGPLDRETIGGSIALSGFGPAGDTTADGQESRAMGECWTHVAKALWKEGATLAYAGRWRGRGDDLVQLLIDELSSWPAELSADKDSREEPLPRFLSFAHGFDPDAARTEAEGILPAPEQRRMGVKLVVERYLDNEELGWGEDWRARAIERFRRRLAVSEASVARFVIGGRPPSDGDRPSGVVEEVIQSLALGRPIYLAGGFGGATTDLGVVLGLSNIRTGSVPDSLKSHLTPQRRNYLEEIADRLRPPPFRSLPVLPEEQVEFLHHYALDGPWWPNNGLNPEDNRKLFRSTRSDEVKDLTIKGLRHVARALESMEGSRPATKPKPTVRGPRSNGRKMCGKPRGAKHYFVAMGMARA